MYPFVESYSDFRTLQKVSYSRSGKRTCMQQVLAESDAFDPRWVYELFSKDIALNCMGTGQKLSSYLSYHTYIYKKDIGRESS